MDQRVVSQPTVAGGEETVLSPDDAARRRHYGQFYGLEEAPAAPGIVLGNCQAESLRIVIGGARLPTVRIPPVHELTTADLPFLDRLLTVAAFVIAQPIRDDYRGLAVGTRQVLERIPASARSVTIPIVRFTGLHPYQSVVRVPEVASAPPIVEYHDVREIARAAGLPLPETLERRAVRAIADDSLAELRRRESGLDVTASDLFDRPSFAQLRTINHPGNPVWLALGERVIEALGETGPATDPGRPLLSSVVAPRERWVADAWDLDEPTSEDWMLGGEAVSAGVVREAQARWYRENPLFVSRAVQRLAPTIERWRAA
jgi:hypothetical protein